MIGLMRNIVPSASRYSLHTSLASSTSTSFGMCAASGSSVVHLFLTGFRVRTRAAWSEMFIRAGSAEHNRSDLSRLFGLGATGRSRRANRHREPDFPSGLRPVCRRSRRVAVRTALRFRSARLPSSAVSGFSCEGFGGFVGLVFDREDSSHPFEGFYIGKICIKRLGFFWHILRRFSLGGPEAVP